MTTAVAQFLTAAELGGLHSEQRALVDFLVLTAGRRFVGFEESTFSLFVREWRYLHGRPRSSSALVAAVVPDRLGQARAHPPHHALLAWIPVLLTEFQRYHTCVQLLLMYMTARVLHLPGTVRPLAK